MLETIDRLGGIDASDFLLALKSVKTVKVLGVIKAGGGIDTLGLLQTVESVQATEIFLAGEAILLVGGLSFLETAE